MDKKLKNQINIGLIGFGTIGSAVARFLMERRSLLLKRTGKRHCSSQNIERFLKFTL